MEEARHALRSYDYVEESGHWFSRVRRMTTQSWREAGEGFLRFDPEHGAWIPIPYELKPEFQGVERLNFRLAEHAACFLWIWPASYVAQIYSDAWEARKAHAEKRALEKGQDAVEAARIAVAEFTPEVEAAVAAAIAEETAVPEVAAKHWWNR